MKIKATKIDAIFRAQCVRDLDQSVLRLEERKEVGNAISCGSMLLIVEVAAVNASAP